VLGGGGAGACLEVRRGKRRLGSLTGERRDTGLWRAGEEAPTMGQDTDLGANGGWGR
jgi:hypothetical protein